MLKLRSLYAYDADGRDIDRFAADFKTILKSFGHDANPAYIDYAWDNGLALELATWRALNLARDEELYSISDEILELIESLRYTEVSDFLDKLESYYLSQQRFDDITRYLMSFPIPERVLRISGWLPETPPRYGFYVSGSEKWSLLLKVTDQKVFSVGLIKEEQPSYFGATLPILEESLSDWQQRVIAENQVYRGAFWHFRDDLYGMAVFKEHGEGEPSHERRIFSHTMWI